MAERINVRVRNKVPAIDRWKRLARRRPRWNTAYLIAWPTDDPKKALKLLQRETAALRQAAAALLAEMEKDDAR
jgi:hypothetical protein